MKICLFIFILFFSATVNASSVSDAIALFKNRNYLESYNALLKNAQNNPDDIESKYYMALCLSQLNRPDQASEVMKELLDLDAPFYYYKILFDLDFDPVRHHLAFQRLLDSYSVLYLDTDKKNMDSLAQVDDLLYLYRNGIKQVIHSGLGNQYLASFKDSEIVEFSWNNLTDPKNPINGSGIFSRKDKKVMSIVEGPPSEPLKIQISNN